MSMTHNAYGKSRVRLVVVTRHGERHDVKDVTVDIRLEGAFESAYLVGDNSSVLPTDTMKNLVYGLAKERPFDQIETFGLHLTEHLLRTCQSASRARVDLAEHLWKRIAICEKLHRHAFMCPGGEKRRAIVSRSRGSATVESGLEDLAVLKTAQSAFEGFPRDRFTTLKETRDRLLATSLAAYWTYGSPDVDYGVCWTSVRQSLLETFAEHNSRSVQHTLYEMAEAVLQSHDEVAGIRLVLPNRHHLLVDLTPFGLENRNEIFVPTDEPHGVVEATVTRA